MKDNIFNNRCSHSKKWIPIRALQIKRNGYGDAIKTIVVRCNSCGEEREQKEVFTDARVDFGLKPYIQNRGAICKNASRKDYKEDEKENIRIFN